MYNSLLDPLHAQLTAYKRKYFLNQLLKGSLLGAALLFSAYLTVNFLEYYGRFGTLARTLLFFTFVGLLLTILTAWIIRPLIHLLRPDRPLTDELAARQIGQFFPEISDKLLNTLQLSHLSGTDNALLAASIQQKTSQLSVVRFTDAVRLRHNRQYIKYAAVPAGLIAGILLMAPQFFTRPTYRLVHFQNEFREEAPFSFIIKNNSLKAYKGEDFTIKLALQGEALPQQVFVIKEGRRFAMTPEAGAGYYYTFKNVVQSLDFTLEAAGFSSGTYVLTAVSRPLLTHFDVVLHYPDYLKKAPERLENTGNMTLPEGTLVRWLFKATDADAVKIRFGNSSEALAAERELTGGFSLQRLLRQSAGYEILLQNKAASNRDPIKFFVNIIPDRHPTISLEQYRDSTLYNFLILGGNISDDYGISNLRLFYRIQRQQAPPLPYRSLPLRFQPGQPMQSYYHQWATDSLRLLPGDRLEYYVQVWDNDGVNGAKSARTSTSVYEVPKPEAIEQQLDATSQRTAQQLDQTLRQAQELKKELEALENRLRTRRDPDFQDRKQLEDLLKQREQLLQQVQQLQQQNELLNQQQQRFQQSSPELQQKARQLQQLMEELMKNDSDKLFEQLKNMLENDREDRLMDVLDKLKSKQKHTEKDLDRALKLFKKLQQEQKMEQAVDKLKKLAEQQEKLADRTDRQGRDQHQKDTPQRDKAPQRGLQKEQADKEGRKDENRENLLKEQEQLEKQMEQVKEQLKEAEKMSEELQQPLNTQPQEQQSISEQQQQSRQQMQKGNMPASAQKQRNASKRMRNMAQQLSQMMASMQTQQQMENMDDLRDILENLVRLSFDQERIMKDFRGLQPADPRFGRLAQEQVRLQDDARIIEDSLYALAGRVVQIKAMVTRELTEMKKSMDDATQFIRDRRVYQATARQQLAMTHVNNLALMLSEVLKQMQESAMAMLSPGSGKQKSSLPLPGMGQQQQQLNQQMQQLDGKQGRALSEKLAQLAAEQAALRKRIQQALDELNGTETGRQVSNEMKEVMKKMEETEEDLVNKRVTPSTINRNKEILTRLLQSEKALKEQEQDPQRKSTPGRELPHAVPPQFQQYLREKQQQTELLRTVPPSFTPFYKQEVNQYFRKLK